MTAASTSTTTTTTTTTLERFQPIDAIPDAAFDAMILEWREHPRVRVRGRRETRWEVRDAATTAALSATWALGPCACAVWAFRRVVGWKNGTYVGAARRRALAAYVAMECGWYAYRRRVGSRMCRDENMKATPTRKDFDRFLQLRYDGVLDFNAFLRGWTKTWKTLAFYGETSEGTSPPTSPPSRTSTPGARDAPAEASFHRETALDFLRFGFHDALRPEEIGEQKERELRFFMDEIEAHWDLRFDDRAEKESFEFMFHTKEKLGALHQPLVFTAWVNGVAGVTGLVLHAWGFKLRHGSNGCAYWTNCETTTEDWKSRAPKTVVVTTRHGRGRETRPVLCGAIEGDGDDETTRPIVFIHGLGVGLAPYLPHISQLLRSKPSRKIALLTLPHISMRAVPRVPELDDMVDTVVEITKKHGFREPTLYGHSFGTFVVARACQRYCVRSVVLLDPVAVCLCLPQTVSILYQLNKSWVDFKRRVRRGPKVLFSSEFWREGGSLVYFCLRDYFLLREIGVMTALRRKFWWARYNLWAEDLPEDSLVVLEGNDLLIDTDAIARHVLRQSKARIIYQERFAHGEFASPWGFGLRDEIVQFLNKDDKTRDPYL